MPFTFLSHQAAVLPLKLRFPRLFSGTALVLGSMAPDFEYFFWGRSLRTVGHELHGQFLLCLPATLLLTWAITRVVARPLALHLPLGPLRLRDYRLLERSPASTGYWARAAVSALVGSFSHIGWDSFTHESGAAAAALGYSNREVDIAGSSIRLYKLLQLGSSLAGAALTLWLLYVIGREQRLSKWVGCEEAPSAAPTPASRAALWGSVVAGALAGAALGLIRLRPVAYDGALGVLEQVGFWGVGCGFLGLVLGSLLASTRMRPVEQEAGGA
jgi:hypothetical protein